MRRFSKMKFADYVRKTREASGLSLRQLSKKADMTLARCFAIEKGEARLNLPQLVSLADAFGFDSGSQFLKKYERTLKAGDEKEPRKRKAAVAAA